MNNKKFHFLALFLCFLFFLLAFFSVEGFKLNDLRYSGQAITTDELAHIPSGYYYLSTGKYFLNVEHPPLIKDLSALPLLFINPTFPKIISDSTLEEGYAWEHYPPEEFEFSKNLEIRNAQWDFARVFLFNPQNNPDFIALWSRLSVIFFNTVFLFVLYLLISKVWNKKIGILSLFLIIFSQFNLANGSLVIMDFMSSVLQMLAIFSFSIYIKNIAEEKRSKASFAGALLFLSLALLSKFSSIILIPSLFIGGGIYFMIIKNNWKDILSYVFKFFILSISALLFIFIFYYFHTFNMDNNDIVSQLNHYYPKGLPFNMKNILITLLHVNPIFKGIVQYMSGVLMVFSRMTVVYQKIFFMGNVYGAEGAGSLYFPILYSAKLPIGLLVFNLIAILLAVWKFIFSKKALSQRTKKFLSNPVSFLIAVFVFCYFAATLSSNLQIGLRHIMPVILGLTILTAKIIVSFWNNKIFRVKLGYIFSLILLLIFFSVLKAFPNYLSYYNYFAGGKDDGYKIATDSNFDWGQDAKKLIKWVDENNIKKFYVDIEGNIPLQFYIGDAYEVLDLEKYSYPQPGSYVAVAISKYEIKNYNFTMEKLIKRIGDTILVFKL